MAGGTVLIQTEDGQVLEGPASQAKEAIAGGARVLNADEEKAYLAQKQYGGATNAVAAAGAGAIDMLTLGAGQGLIKEGLDTLDPQMGARFAQNTQGLIAAHPYAHAGGMLGGAVAGAVLTGGEATAAEGEGILGAGRAILGAPSSIAGEFGAGAARASTNVLGEGLGGRLLSKAIGGAVTGGTEGAIFGAGSAYSDAALQDHELTAERLLAGAGEGALFGGLLGGGIGAGGELVSTGAKAGIEALGSKLEGVSGKLDDLSNELRYSSTGAKTPEIRKLEAGGLTTKEVGDWMNRELGGYNGGKMPLTQEGILTAAQKAADDYGARVGSKVQELDAAAAAKGAQPDAAKLINRLEQEVYEPLAKKLGQDAAAAKVRNVIDQASSRLGLARNEAGELVAMAPTKYSDLYTVRKELDDLAWRGRKVLDESNVTAELRNARRVVDDELRTQGQAVAGDEWRTSFDAANRGVRMATKVTDATEKSMARTAGNRGISLTDTIAGATGLASFGPTGLALAGANKLLRTYGDAVGASLLGKLSKMEAIRAASDAVDSKLRSGVKGFLTGKGTGTGTGAAIATSLFKERSDRIGELAGDPRAMTQAATMNHADVAPEIAGQYATKSAAAVAYLNQQLPRGFIIASPMTPHMTGELPRAQKVEWLQRLAVVQDPSVVISAMSNGTITQAHVDTLKAVYPRLYQSIQEHTMEGLTDMAAKGDLPSAPRRLALGTLLDIPADATLVQSFISSQQPSATPLESGQEGTSPPAPRPQSMPSTALLTESQKLEMG